MIPVLAQESVFILIPIRDLIPPPAILFNPLMAVSVDQATGENGTPSTTQVTGDATPDGLTVYMALANQYFKVRPPPFHRLSQHEQR